MRVSFAEIIVWFHITDFIYYRYAAGFERVWTLILAWKPEKTLKISSEEYTDGSSPPSSRISQSIIRELCIALLSADPVPRPGSTQIKLDVNAEPPWDPDPLC
ncbi:Uncharacterized protein BM_BM10272 [Brugia malayi]|uniref:Uncharacterized protein n=1 Tax=Brugia malayi TaxID=6279 RepID=A0A4E9FJ15_BRUMA|nr:Uncharacterized protein BM_BM10272 [Brugia malayi]VIO96981.1 Uncharacterized protein BM_BM10272 [Brugia malayi]